MHHAWQEPDAHARRPFDRIADHIFMPFASSVTDADARLAPRAGGNLLDDVLALVPDEWLGERPDAERRAYRSYLDARLDARPTWVGFAERARQEAQRDAA